MSVQTDIHMKYNCQFSTKPPVYMCIIITLFQQKYFHHAVCALLMFCIHIPLIIYSYSRLMPTHRIPTFWLSRYVHTANIHSMKNWLYNWSGFLWLYSICLHSLYNCMGSIGKWNMWSFWPVFHGSYNWWGKLQPVLHETWYWLMRSTQCAQLPCQQLFLSCASLQMLSGIFLMCLQNALLHLSMWA